MGHGSQGSGGGGGGAAGGGGVEGKHKKRETKNKKHAKSFVCLSFCVVPIREREPAPSAKGARGKMASFLVASSRASRSRLCVDAGIAHATVLPEAGRTKDSKSWTL